MFRLLTNGYAAVNDYVALWDEFMPRFWRESPIFDGVSRVMVDISTCGAFDVMYLYAKARESLSRLDKIPPGRIAYLMHPQPRFIQQTHTLSELLVTFQQIERRYFMPMERAQAIAWLLED